MIYSRRQRFVFIHIQRTGGTSLATLLKEGIRDARKLGWEHNRATRAIEIIGSDEFFACYRFSFVRNPWDRMVSWFHRGKQEGRIIKRRFDIRRDTTFEEFLTETLHPRLYMQQLEYLSSLRGKLLVDNIFRFEDYLPGVRSLCQRFAIDPSRLPHETASRHEHYTTYYTDATRQLVAERFADDIARFGYTFG
jgi:hypothetical protein